MPIIEYDEFSEFQQEHFTFQGQCAKVLIPAEKANGKWAIKTEYFGAFPELEMLHSFRMIIGGQKKKICIVSVISYALYQKNIGLRQNAPELE